MKPKLKIRLLPSLGAVNKTRGEAFVDRLFELAKRRALRADPPVKGLTELPALLRRHQHATHRYHPAFDIGDGVLAIGFDVDTPVDDVLERETLHVVSVRGEVTASEDAQVEVGQQRVRFLKKFGPLPLIDREMRVATLGAFLKSPHALSGGELFSRLKKKVERHVDFAEPGEAVIVVCWGVMTYVYPLFSSVPYLSFLGAKGTGKSQSLDLLAQLTRNGYKSHATTAVIGDLIQSQRPTLLLDQADNMQLDQIDLLAESYRAGARRAIVDMDHRGQPKEFETFGPKVFAGTKMLDDDLADRAILITTSPAARPIDPITPGDMEATELREETYKWALLNFYKLRALPPFAETDWPGLAPYTGRQRDLWFPIEVMMEALNVPEEDRKAARDYYARSQASTKAELNEKHADLLRVLRQIVGEKETAEVSSTELLEKLGPQGEIDLDEPDGWTPQRLGKALKSLNVLLNVHRTRGNKARQYVIDGGAVRSAADRYSVTD